MPIVPGDTLGHYQIAAKVGEGGMGVVFRARDRKLDRDVALKLLPEAVSTDPERLARFEREAKTLAALNHPNIAAIYGVEQTGGLTALVLEFVDGPTLAERLEQGPIEISDAVGTAIQIAEALQAAHERAIVHRDLKPANVKVRGDGTVKVLDFGLAKALAAEADGSGAGPVAMTQLATVTSPAATQLGTILGTAAYMSPEQAKGQPADKRSDIWSFGCVLYEMLSGSRAFTGDDVLDVLGAVARLEPDWSRLPATLPRALDALVKGCLVKNRHERIGDVASVLFVLRHHQDWTATAGPDVDVSPRRRRRLATHAAALALGAGVAGLTALRLAPATAPAPVSRFEHLVPDNQRIRIGSGSTLAISRDGRRFVYNTDKGLFVRSMNSLDASVVGGTGPSVRAPAFSPDGQALAYYENRRLMRVALSGGAPTVVCEVPVPVWRASWERDGTILFGGPEGIMRVAASGGAPTVAVRAQAGERMASPHLLPDGDTVLFTLASGVEQISWDRTAIVAQSLRTGRRTVLVQGGTDARYVASGHLVYAFDTDLLAVPFDARRLTVGGAPVRLLQEVSRDVATGGGGVGPVAAFAISDDGTLIYMTGSARMVQRTLAWVDRAGRETAVEAEPHEYQYPRLSPDGSRLALEARDARRDIWIWNFAATTLQRLTFSPSRENYPVWTPDGRTIIFADDPSSGAQRLPANDLYRVAADGSGSPERLVELPGNQIPYAVTPDGRELLFRDDGETQDLMALSLDGSAKTRPVVRTQFNELNGELSADGRWLAFESDQSGESEIYVRPFADGGAIRQVSNSGGTRPLWARSGRELFYVDLDGAVMSVPIGDNAVALGAPKPLLTGRYFSGATTGAAGRTYDVSPDGSRFLMIKLPDGPSARIVVVQNWAEELKRLVSSH